MSTDSPWESSPSGSARKPAGVTDARIVRSRPAARREPDGHVAVVVLAAEPIQRFTVVSGSYVPCW